jgi:hypothetical protein
MNTEPQPSVEACCRCGQPAERPAVGEGHVAGAEVARAPLCVDCLQLLLDDAEAFWRPLRRAPEQ